MANVAPLVHVILFSLVRALAMGEALIGETTQLEDRRSSLGLGPEKVTRLHFYFHNSQTGPSTTTTRIGHAPGTDSSPTLFGLLMIADDPLTVGPEPTSQEVGRAQGMYCSAGRDTLNIVMAYSFRFTSGKYNGSSFSVMSQNLAGYKVRELAVVGGTSQFRLARGFASAKTFMVNTTTANTIVEYHVTLVH